MYRDLRDLDLSLKESGYYTPVDGSFSAWNGEQGAIFKAYSLVDQDEMKDYFANQSARILTMVINNAEPIIEVMKADLFDLDIDQVKLISRWHNLVEQAIAYKKKKVSGSMKSLEKFMEKEGNEITYEACFTSLDPNSFDKPSSDYFTNKKHELMKGMYKRCQEIAAEKGAAQYKKVQNIFNTYIANTFPSWPKVPRTPQIEAEVSWPVLQDLFEALKKLTPGVRAAIKNTSKYNQSWKEVEMFLTQLDATQEFFRNLFCTY
ncbi:MAG: hypothetical protein H6925_02160 [Holosporaceae bacterium]|nr:MAG: hypothetical protein H6925_02160 [Holosporaceae bacterium]